MYPKTIQAHDTKGFQHRILMDDVMIAFEAGEFTLEGMTLGAIRELKRVYQSCGGGLTATRPSVRRVFKQAPVVDEPNNSTVLDIFA